MYMGKNGDPKAVAKETMAQAVKANMSGVSSDKKTVLCGYLVSTVGKQTDMSFQMEAGMELAMGNVGNVLGFPKEQHHVVVAAWMMKTKSAAKKLGENSKKGGRSSD